MQHNFAFIVLLLDTPHAGAIRKNKMKKWKGMSTKRLSKKISHLPKTIKETEDQAMYQNNGPEARIPREETRTKNNDGSLKNSTTAHQNFSPRPNSAYSNNHPNNGRSYDQRPIRSLNRNGGSWLRNGSFNNQSGNWRSFGIFLVFH